MAEYLTKAITVTIDGTKKRKWIRAKTKKELEQKIFEIRIREQKGEFSPIRDDVTLGEWTLTWLEQYKKERVSQDEYEKYYRVYTNFLMPTIGGKKLKSLTQLDIQAFLNSFAGYSKSYIDFATKMIKSIIRRAEANKIADSSIIIDIVPPVGTYKGKRPLTKDERRAFMVAMDKHPYGMMFGIILACGFRPGEVRALTMADIDMKTGDVYINKAVKSGTNIVVGLPKSDAGTRIGKMPRWYFDKFKEYAQGKKAKELVFPTIGTGKIISKRHIIRIWSSYKREMDIVLGAKLYRNKIVESVLDNNITPYYLRHTFCTDLASAGVPLKTAQYLMGHASPDITARIYTHYQSDTRDAAIDALDKLQSSFE